MSTDGPMTPETASTLARWAGLRDTATPEKLAEVFEGFRPVIERIYSLDVEGFEFDFLQPDSRAR